MIGWYSRFIAQYSTIMVPLTNMLRKAQRWACGNEEQSAFEELKVALTKAPVLARPNFDLPFTIQTDASNYAIGAVLSQEENGEKHPICFVSRVLSKAERNYTVTEKECLTVIWAVDKLRPYVQGYEFTVVTDHASLKWLNNLKDPAGRLARWATALQGYHVNIVHRKGTEHKVPDALSRAYEDSEVGQIASIVSQEPPEPHSWYEGRRLEIIKYPEKFPDWAVHGDLIHIHRLTTGSIRS